MTKEEFKGFSSAAQHDMVLEALVRITKNLETMEKESGKPFAGTSKQRRNDIKLLTILAEAFGKNELIWDNARVYKNAIDDDWKKTYITTGATIDGVPRCIVEGLQKLADAEMRKKRSK